MSAQDIRSQQEMILSLDKESTSDRAGGMAGYGTRFDGQRDYYKSLSQEEKSAYEDAVIAISQVPDAARAEVGLYICGELADLFPTDWGSRVTSLLNRLTERGLPLAYHGAISHAVIRLIRIFRVESLIPFLHGYLEDLREMREIGRVQASEAKVLLQEISRTLISVAPDDFWGEFSPFDRDARLFSRSEEEEKELFYFWASSGMRVYGLDWLRRLTAETSKIPDEALKSVAYRAIRDEARYLQSTSEEVEPVTEFMDWLGRISGMPDSAD
jgi:hypothetical protein